MHLPLQDRARGIGQSLLSACITPYSIQLSPEGGGGVTSGGCVEVYISPKEDSCFSIYQISWIKIKKELFENKRLHLEFVYAAIDSVSGIIFYAGFCCQFFFLPVNADKPNFVSFLVFQLLV